MRISDWSSDVCSSDLIHAERPCTEGDGLADAPHADDAQRLAHQRMAQHDRGAPAGPPALAQDLRILAETARAEDDERQRQFGGVAGEDAGGVRCDALACAGGGAFERFGATTQVGDRHHPFAVLPTYSALDV